MSDLDPHRKARVKHVQFRMRADMYAFLAKRYPHQSVGVTARNLLEQLVETLEEPDK